jgi:acyl-CoA synthetase (AMP-forming)/AMP-acid ligase II
MSESTEGPADPRTISDMFRRRLQWDPDREFLLVPDGRAWTFRDLAALTDNLTARLHDDGVRPGRVVGLYLWNEPAWFVAVLAAWRLGAVAALCGAVSPPNEAARRFELVGPQVVIAGDAPSLEGRLPVIEVGIAGELATGGGRAASARSASDMVPDPDDPACVFFTAGTTGAAKAVVKSHGQLAQAPRMTAEAYARSAAFRPRMAGPDKPPALSFNPFGHAASFGRLVFRLYIGRPLVMLRKFDVETVSRLAGEYRLDTLQMTPAMVHALAFADADIDLRSLKYVNSGTAPLPLATRDAFETRYGVPVLQAYGSTEGGVTALERYEDVIAGRRGPGSVGRITPESRWRIVDLSGQDVPVGVDGEILGKPDQHTLKTDGDESRLPLDADGWYHTGDLGHVDEDSILYVTGRLKEMMIVGGFNVFPGEVEDVLRSSALVRDAVVVPLPDERLGEIPVAGIVWDGTAAVGVSEPERFRRVAAESRNDLAAYKVPRRWFTLAELPLTPNSKLDRLGAARAALMSAQSLDTMGAGGDGEPAERRR